jgi:hypothetical protein
MKPSSDDRRVKRPRLTSNRQDVAASAQPGRRRIVALYWENIDRRLVEAQARVFAHFGYAIEQFRQNRRPHGEFLDEIMQSLGADDAVLCMDIDCFPTNRDVVERAFAAAESGGLLGCAQVSANIDPNRIFTAPMFLALSRRTWDGLGRPSFVGDAHGDVAQGVHDAAVAAGVKVEYLYPWACVVPKWSLAGQVLFGIGTFYRGGVFHLYESRNSPYAFIAFQVADDVLAGGETDILALCDRAMRLYPLEHIVSRWLNFLQFRRPKRWWAKAKALVRPRPAADAPR